jgi:hypothetical protein
VSERAPGSDIPIEFDMETFGRFLRAVSGSPLSAEAARAELVRLTNGIDCPECGTYVTFRSGTCSGCGWDM